MGTHKRTSKKYLDEARLLARDPEALAYHFEEMDKFFKKNPSIKKKWDEFHVNEMLRKVK